MRINATLIIFSLLALPAFAFAEDLLPTPEALVITGDKVLTFTSRSIEGTKEGFVPGVTREESLKLTISGKAADTEINANIFSTATTGTTQVTENEDKISVLLRHGATEAYFGDFTAYFSGLEFANINKVLQGVRLRGDYDMWGFEAIGSSPKGDSRQMKMYGNGTQGPYYLGSAPVVINSEKVFVNGAPLKRGDDYDIDYEAGNVTFRKKVIQNIDIIQVDYEYRETLYQHSTYAFRLFGRPYQNLNLGATYI
ncbi:MAG: hypothetical protein NT030_05790, partial [Candidatus Saganbacteria bacterium]|nr:hypothetical protein [Candidatus Saganbacteria bacterium]